MKSFIVALLAGMVVCFSVGSVLAQTPAPAQGIGWNLAIGQDNAWLFSPNKARGFLAVGAGIDVASYTKKLSLSGSTLALYLHGTVLTAVTGDIKTPIVGAAINCDVLQLLNGSRVKILIPQLSVLAGPIAAYDMGRGEVVYGGLLNFNYKF